MQPTRSLNIILPVELAAVVEAKVNSGEYATESEVVHDGLRALLARDADVERWIVTEVVPTLEAAKADPSRLVDADTAWALISKHMGR